MNQTYKAFGEEDQDVTHDDTALAGIQEALKEIEKLENESNSDDSFQEDEVEKEAPDEEEVATEEEDTEEEKPKKEKKEKKIWQYRRDTYRANAIRDAAIAEKEAALEKTAQLEQMLTQALEAGNYHYGKNAFSELENAKASKRRAIENGDVEALIEADVLLSRAMSNISELERGAYEDKNRKQTVSNNPPLNQQQAQRVNEVDTTTQERIADWIEDHDYLQPHSPKYDSKFAGQVASFIEDMDIELEEEGKLDSRFSRKYFKQINEYIDQSLNKRQKSLQNINGLNHVGAVRNSFGGANAKSSSTMQVSLSADEKRMCADMGIKESEWIRSKIKQLEKQKGEK